MPNEGLYSGMLEDTGSEKLIQIGKVVAVDDENYLGRIKVEIKGTRSKGGDDGIMPSEVSWAFPLLPKTLATRPKIGEAVLIFIFSKDRQFADRLYIGPIISQPQNLKLDKYDDTSLAPFTFSTTNPQVDPNTYGDIRGVFPNQKDVSIQGRYNTEITQKENEVIIKAGKFVKTKPTNTNPFDFKFNSETQGYIQIKNDVVTVPADEEKKQKEERGTITNIVSNKINLLTHKDTSPIFNLTNQENLISDEVMGNILKTAHPLPFGDILLQYLRLLKEAALNHVHNGNSKKPTDLVAGGEKLDVQEFKDKAANLEKEMLSKNIRIN